MEFIIEDVIIEPRPTEFKGRLDWYKMKEQVSVPKEIEDFFDVPDILKIDDKTKIIGDYIYGIDILPYRTGTKPQWRYTRGENPLIKMQNEYDRWIPTIEWMRKFKGKVVKISDLPLSTKFRDFNKPHLSSNFEISVQQDGPNLGSAGGPTTVVLVELGHLKVKAVDGKCIKEICCRCNQIVKVATESEENE